MEMEMDMRLNTHEVRGVKKMSLAVVILYGCSRISLDRGDFCAMWPCLVQEVIMAVYPHPGMYWMYT